MRNRRGRPATYLTVFLLLVFMTALGCSKITQENYDRLSVGMDYKEVLEILGEPDECTSLLNAKNCVWGDAEKNITIKIIADKVVFLSSRGLS